MQASRIQANRKQEEISGFPHRVENDRRESRAGSVERRTEERSGIGARLSRLLRSEPTPTAGLGRISHRGLREGERSFAVDEESLEIIVSTHARREEKGRTSSKAASVGSGTFSRPRRPSERISAAVAMIVDEISSCFFSVEAARIFERVPVLKTKRGSQARNRPAS